MTKKNENLRGSVRQEKLAKPQEEKIGTETEGCLE